MRPTRRAFLGSSAALAGTALAGCLGRVPEPACPPAVESDGAVRIGFVGDTMLGRNVDATWDGRDPAGVWGSTIDRLDVLDGLVLNLECCVSERGRRTPGRGYYFRAGPDWAVPALQAAGTSVAGLANNHLLDFGYRALRDTVTHLEAGGIATTGAGADRSAAAAPATVTVGGIEVAVVALTDQAPLYTARGNSPGTAYTTLSTGDPLSRRRIDAALSRARERDPDLLVATLHWGPNWEVRPSEGQQRTARWLIDRGVDVVHGHSAHVIQGVETYRGRPIVYDAGDFVDDYLIKEGLHNDRSFLFELVVADGTLRALDLVPVVIDDSAVGLAGETAATWLRERLRTLSEPFGTTVERAGDGLRIPLGEC
ncbi:CapA family protein [Haloarcula pelagica]|uniref:CapA family protein n=1 Tax=Haloarcula pelagica TaxID=3033389 RepID=UPI0024C2294C|nr:CapA family protein [Halomicroarcula sp. YJ-61-S]